MTNPVPPVLPADIYAHLQTTAFGNLGDQALGQLSKLASVERFQVPTLLSAAGQPLTRFRLVVEGHIEIVARRASGKEVVLNYVSPGAWATWLACFMDTPPDNDFYSSAGACFISWPTAEIRTFCAQNPKIYPFIIGEVGRRMRLLTEWTGQSLLVGPEQRMAKLLYLMAREQKHPVNPATLHVTQARLASLARCSRQTANALLSALEARGLISLAYGKFEIVDLPQLAAFADAELPE